MTTHVIYHGFCADGFTSAWILWNHIKKQQNKKPEEEPSDVSFHAANYGEEPPRSIEPHDSVIIADFSYSRPVLEELRNNCADLLVLDHHKTAMDDLFSFSDAIFDMKRSGCGITWDYFNSGVKRPTLVNYMEDRDLWNFKLPHSEEIFNYVTSYKYNFHTWDYLSQLLDTNFDQCVREGAAIKRFIYQVVDNAITHNLLWVELEGLRTPCLSIGKEFGSIACHELTKRFQVPYAIYFCFSEDKTFYGIRGDGSVDVSAIAKKFGGGGHKNASGWQFERYISPNQLEDYAL